MNGAGQDMWRELKLWLGAHPVQAFIVFFGINFVGVFAAQIVSGFAGDFAGLLVRGLCLAAAIAVGIAFLSARWDMRR